MIHLFGDVMLDKHERLQFVVNFLGEIPVVKRTFENELLKLKTNLQNLQSLARKITPEEFDQAYLIVEEEFKRVKKNILADPAIAQAILFELDDTKIGCSITANNTDTLSKWLRVRHTIFIDQEHSDANEKLAYTKFLSWAIEAQQFDMATMFLEKGADPNAKTSDGTADVRSPLYKAASLEKNAIKFLELLVSCGGRIDFTSAYFSPLGIAIERGDVDVVTRLLTESKRDSDFEFSLKKALSCNKVEIACFLLTVMRKSPNLQKEYLHYFLTNASLKMLRAYLEDPQSSIQERLTIPINTTGPSGLRKTTSGEVLLKSLLNNTAHPTERLAVFKQAIKQWLTLDFLRPDVEAEPCFRDKNNLERLAQDPSGWLVNELAKELLTSIQRDTQQGRVAVGFRVLCNLRFNEEQGQFSTGIKFIDLVGPALNEFKEKNGLWPDEVAVDSIIEEAANSLLPISESSSNTSDAETDWPADNEEAAKRFRAMVGSDVFTKLNPTLPGGGRTYEVGKWYGEILQFISQSMSECGMLREGWKKEDTERLLRESTGVSSFSDSEEGSPLKDLDVDQVSYGFSLDFPKHFIPSCIYQDKNGTWRYTVMCREFIPGGGADFIISKDSIPALKKMIQKFKTPQSFDSPNTKREILYGLIKHLTEVEALTGVSCIYSSLKSLKPYKGPTCFASNLKGLLSIILTTMAKTTTMDEQWNNFNHKLKECIIAEMAKTNISWEEPQQPASFPTMKAAEPEHIAYKFVTLLLRWSEINQFNPSSADQIKGKQETIKHVLMHTKNRFNLVFFKEDTDKDPDGRNSVTTGQRL